MTAALANDIEFRSVTKLYGSVTAVSDINLAVPKGAFVALLGPSGCGKTTCLRMIGGFEQPTEGTVLIDGREMNGVPAYRRPVNMVFQHYALFPHFDVEQNVAYGLKQARPKLASSEISARARQALEMVRLGGFEKRRIHEMSGGQQQRVALARAIVNKPSVHALNDMSSERRRDGAYGWGVTEDSADPEKITEWFMVESWAEHLRQHKRVSNADADLQSKVLAFHSGAEKPVVRHLLSINRPGKVK